MLEHLVQTSGPDLANGNGNLVDGRLRYGSRTHGGKSGVFMSNDGLTEQFRGTTGWVALELHAVGTTKLRGGRKN